MKKNIRILKCVLQFFLFLNLNNCSEVNQNEKLPILLASLFANETINTRDTDSVSDATNIILYVRQSDGVDTNDGSKSSPLLTIGRALQIIEGKQVSGEVHIAAGTYNESIAINRNISLYGGYDQSNWDNRNNKDRSNVTFRTRIQGTSSPTVNISQGISQKIKLDGLNILGHASSNSVGISVNSPIELSNNTLDGSHATSSAIRLSNSGNSLILKNDIWSNVPHSYGLYIENSSPYIINNVIRGGSSAVIYVTGTSAVGIYSNHITNGGRGIDLSGTGVNADLKNNIIINNSTHGIYNVNSTVNATYNDVWNNSTNYSNVTAGTGSISSNPLLVSTTDFRLQTSSVLICAGTDLTSQFSSLGLSIDDKNDIARISTGNIYWNIGAFETAGANGLTGCL